jgi:hypothetical protein
MTEFVSSIENIEPPLQLSLDQQATSEQSQPLLATANTAPNTTKGDAAGKKKKKNEQSVGTKPSNAANTRGSGNAMFSGFVKNSDAPTEIGVFMLLVD